MSMLCLDVAEASNCGDSDASRLHAGAHFGAVSSHGSSQVSCHMIWPKFLAHEETRFMPSRNSTNGWCLDFYIRMRHLWWMNEALAFRGPRLSSTNLSYIQTNNDTWICVHLLFLPHKCASARLLLQLLEEISMPCFKFDFLLFLCFVFCFEVHI